MSAKEIEVNCPCCDTQLTIDVLTRTVLRSVSPDDRDESGRPKRGSDKWDSAHDRVQDRTQRKGDALDGALSNERARRDSLEDRFDQARHRLREPQDDDE